jgi:predicted RND superfamily exporter protein
MTPKKRKILYWSFKIAGIIISCIFPIWAIIDKFPLWIDEHGTGRTVGVGVILIVIVLLVVFRKTVFNFLRDKLDLKHAPPLAIWFVALAIAYTIIFIGNFMKDMTIVLWMGLIGCTIGTALTFVSNRFADKKKEKDVTSNE